MTDMFQAERGPTRRTFCGTGQWGRTKNDDSRDGSIGVDADLAREMNELSVQEREKVLDDMHGVAEVLEETPEMLTSYLDGLDKALAKLPRSIRKAFDRAMFLRPELETDSKFKLPFLRADCFNIDLASKRMANFFTQKQILFGEDKLVKKISLDDLSEHEINLLKSGSFIELPNRDPIGRPIIMVDFTKFDLSDQNSMARVAWYHIMSGYDDETGQRKGIVNLALCDRNLRDLPNTLGEYAEHFKIAGGAIGVVPRRITSYHFCYNDPGLRFILSLIQRNFGKNIRLRMRLHCGSAIEIQYSLMTFGISCRGFLFREEDALEQQLGWYFRVKNEADEKERQYVTSQEKQNDIIVYPSPEDALIGRGHPYHDFSGTRRLIDLIDAELVRYSRSDDRFWKTCVAMEVVKKVQEWNGRFLHRTETGWKVLDDNSARGKVINLFRYKRNLQEKSTSGKNAKRAKLS